MFNFRAGRGINKVLHSVGGGGGGGSRPPKFLIKFISEDRKIKTLSGRYNLKEVPQIGVYIDDTKERFIVAELLRGDPKRFAVFPYNECSITYKYRGEDVTHGKGKKTVLEIENRGYGGSHTLTCNKNKKPVVSDRVLSCELVKWETTIPKTFPKEI